MILSTLDLSKSYPGVQALDKVDFDLRPGEVHCLVGENGAGKSTFIKVLSGALTADSGHILLDGRDVRFSSPHKALQAGIATIFQESNLVPELSVAENILLAREPRRKGFRLLDRAAMRSEALAALEQVGETIDPDVPARALTPAQHQMVEIAKAVSRRSRIVIMDEPTAALTDRETVTLFTLIRRLSSQGIAFIYISHRLEEIAGIGTRITVLRDGKKIGTIPASTDRTEIIRMMVGRDIPAGRSRAAVTNAQEILSVEGLTSRYVSDCSFTLHEGEILGIAGLAGSGRSELARCLFGADERMAGTVRLYGSPYHPSEPADALRSGVAFLTEDRNRLGLFLSRPIRENISLPTLDEDLRWGLINKRSEHRRATLLAERFHVKFASLSDDVDTLSGGNRQKVLLARWLARTPRLVIVDEPTAGIDVGAKSEIHEELRKLADSGVGVIVISSELPELLSLCSRIIVMRESTIIGSLDRSEASEERIVRMSMRTASEPTEIR